MSGKAFAVFMAVLAVIGLLGFGVISKSEGRLDVGDKPPVSELELLAPGAVEGSAPTTTASLADYRGQWVLLNVWASWCAPCRDEAPALQAFYAKHRGQEFTVLGIDTQDSSDDALAFAHENGLEYPSLRDGSGSYADDLKTTGVPESFLIDPDGKIALGNPGPVTPEYLDQAVLPLIEGRTVPAT